jgi:dual specificity protein phosphatase-like protein
MQLYPIDDEGRLFMSADLRDWSHVVPYGIDVVIDVDGGLDACIPTHSNHCLYIYFPFDDDDQFLPNEAKLRAIAQLGASLIQDGHRVLAHCNMGYNRSGLVAGLILKALGLPGAAAVTRIRERRPGALFNDRFAEYLVAKEASDAAEAGGAG